MIVNEGIMHTLTFPREPEQGSFGDGRQLLMDWVIPFAWVMPDVGGGDSINATGGGILVCLESVPSPTRLSPASVPSPLKDRVPSHPTRRHQEKPRINKAPYSHSSYIASYIRHPYSTNCTKTSTTGGSTSRSLIDQFCQRCSPRALPIGCSSS